MSFAPKATVEGSINEFSHLNGIDVFKMVHKLPTIYRVSALREKRAVNGIFIAVVKEPFYTEGGDTHKPRQNGASRSRLSAFFGED